MYGRIRGMRIKRLGASTRQEPRDRALVYGLEGADFVVLLEEMRSRAGLSIPQIAAGLGVYPNAVYQYFHKKRGRGGTSTLRWFLRYASACGCEVTLTFPVPKRGRTRYGSTARQFRPSVRPACSSRILSVCSLRSLGPSTALLRRLNPP